MLKIFYHIKNVTTCKFKTLDLDGTENKIHSNIYVFSFTVKVKVDSLEQFDIYLRYII